MKYKELTKKSKLLRYEIFGAFCFWYLSGQSYNYSYSLDFNISLDNSYKSV